MRRGLRFLAVVALSLAGLELGLRLCVRPAQTSYGLLLGQELPPLKVIMNSPLDPDSNLQPWKANGKPNPYHLTKGDLWGYLREDAELGYTSEENATSVHRWWSSNNVGARSVEPTGVRVPPGRRRVLIFGASYALGSRVAQDQTYFKILADRYPQLEFVNLAVDGYSMAQSYLRFHRFARTHDYDLALFVFVPDNNVWRDDNVLRYLAEGWSAFIILPRYVWREGDLHLVPAFYPHPRDVYKANLPDLSSALRAHLIANDPFYNRWLFESPPWFGSLILEKAVAKIIGQSQQNSLYEHERSDPDAPGMQIIRALFRRAADEAHAQGKDFAITLLPDAEILTGLRGGGAGERREIWRHRLESLRAEGLTLTDLLPPLLDLPSSALDQGYDGSHYGPKTNAAMAGWIEAQLRGLGYIP